MKNNKIFNFGLFKEGIRQLRAIGIAFLCISGMLTLYKCFTYIGSIVNAYEPMVDDRYIPKVDPSSWNNYFIAFVAVYFIIPVLTFMMFNFLNSRSASDYYHSVPKSRLSVALSFSASIFFWYFMPILLNTVCEIAIGAVCGAEILWAEIGMYLLGMLASFIQLYGIMLLAVSLATGILNQLAASLIIAFLPRLMMTLISVITNGTIPVLGGYEEILGSFGEYDFNLIFSGVLSIDSIVSAKNIWVILYAILLGVIYGALGLLAFCKRKSEAATTAGANKYVQCAIRVLVAFVVCLIPCYQLGEVFITLQGQSIIRRVISLLPSTILLYGIALVAYFLYEAITARKIRGVVTLRGTMGIGLAALAVLNLVFIFSPAAIAKIALSKEINTSNVSSVSVIDEEALENYYKDEINAFKFTDESIIKTLCDTLDNNIQTINSGYRNDLYGLQKTSVVFNMKDGRKYRRFVYMSELAEMKLVEDMYSNEEYFEIVRRLPGIDELKKDKIYYSLNGVSEGAFNFDELYSILRAEISEMSDEEYKKYEYVNEENSLLRLSIYSSNDDNWTIGFNIGPLVPKTMAYCVENINKYYNMQLEDKSLAEMYEQYEYAYIYITYCDSKNQYCESLYYDKSEENEKDNKAAVEMLKVVDNCRNTEVDPSEEIYMITYNFDLPVNTENEYSANGIILVPAAELKGLIEK